MKRTHRNVLLFVGVALAGYFLTSTFASSMSSPPTTASGSSESFGTESSQPSSPGEDLMSSPPPAPGEPAGHGSGGTAPTDGAEGDAATRSYAIALHELPGLPPDAPAGAQLEVWAVWRPPITKERQVQKLVSGARLERIVPPLTPEGPPVAVLEVPEKELSDLLFGDKFGDLSVAVTP